MFFGATFVVLTFRPFRPFRCECILAFGLSVALPFQCISIFCWYSTSCINWQLVHGRQNIQDAQSSHFVPSRLYLVLSFVRKQQRPGSPHKQHPTKPRSSPTAIARPFIQHIQKVIWRHLHTPPPLMQLKRPNCHSSTGSVLFCILLIVELLQLCDGLRMEVCAFT